MQRNKIKTEEKQNQFTYKHTATYKHMHKEEQSMYTQAQLSLQHYIQISMPTFPCSLQDIYSP